VRRPGQYVGLETNARCGDRPALVKASGGVAVALAFPDTYAIGISHLGGQVLYHALNGLPGVACDRTYCPQTDAEDLMRTEGIPLFAWESRCAVRDFDILGFSLPYELCVTNVLTMLDLAGIPLHAADRGAGDPIVVGGDALADTPEPLADFLDLFLPGDGEEPLAALVELVRQLKGAGATRDRIILEAAKSIPSCYAPGVYQPRYGPDGAFHSLAVAPEVKDVVPSVIRRAHVNRLSDSPAVTCPLVPLSEGVHERVVVEVMRGCPNSCRFCQAGHTRLPVRRRSVEEIVEAARQAVAATGFHEISLLSLSTSDYGQLEELIDRLSAEFTPRHVSISLPSLRVDSQLRLLPRLTSQVRKGGLTIAAEAGSRRLRRAIGKDISDDDMIAGVRAAYAAGWRSVKVYFMAGLPGETAEDVDAIFDLCRRLSDARKDVDAQRGAITASVSWFVPKPHTPMQWCAMRDAEYFFWVRRRLRELSRRSPITFRFHRIERSLLEGLIARGDRRVGAVIEGAWRRGARLDSWDEHFDFALWQEAMREADVDLGAVVGREIPLDAAKPWSHIACYRDEDFLRSQYQAMLSALNEEQQR
jgi:radical SAM family uncharacterized protein